MRTAQQHLEQWNLEHRQPDDLRHMLRHSDPSFDSAKQFGVFIACVWEEWSRTPGLDSWMGQVLDDIERGTVVDSSPRPPQTYRRQAYHIDWIQRVLEESLRTLHRQFFDEDRPQEIYQIWGETDVAGRTRRSVADYYDRSTETVQRWLRTGRNVVYSELVRAGRASRQPAANRQQHRRRTRRREKRSA